MYTRDGRLVGRDIEVVDRVVDELFPGLISLVVWKVVWRTRNTAVPSRDLRRAALWRGVWVRASNTVSRLVVFVRMEVFV